MSGQYNLPVPGGVGRRANAPGSDAPSSVPGDAYRSTFAQAGHASSFVWSGRAAPLAHILKDNTLPLIVKISEEANVRTDGENTMDFRQPLLLYREHQTARLYARNIVSSSAGKKEAGPFVVIPQNYPGLFRPSGKPGKPLSSISTVARLMPASILSLTPCDGYVCVSANDSDVIYQKTSLEPGQYVIKDLLEDQIAIGSGAGQKSKKKKLVRCLRCVNEGRKVVLFPLKANGQFYVAALTSADSGGGPSSRQSMVDSTNRVYRWTEMTSLPPGSASPDNSSNSGNCDIVADLIHGNPPPQQCKFTGTLAFKHVSRDHTVVGCTTAEATSQQRLFELSPGQKGPSFVLALNQDCFDSEESPLGKCLSFVKREFDRYVSGMKVRRDYEVDCTELRESST